MSYASAEGAMGGMGSLIDQVAKSVPAAYSNIVQFAAETCELPQFRDGGEHLHFVVRSPAAIGPSSHRR